MFCLKCKNTGIIETGNNDLRCSCQVGSEAVFNIAGQPFQEGPFRQAKEQLVGPWCSRCGGTGIDESHVDRPRCLCPAGNKVRLKCTCGGEWQPLRKGSVAALLSQCSKCFADGPFWADLENEQWAEKLKHETVMAAAKPFPLPQTPMTASLPRLPSGGTGNGTGTRQFYRGGVQGLRLTDLRRVQFHRGNTPARPPHLWLQLPPPLFRRNFSDQII